jgi:hypothetical protein
VGVGVGTGVGVESEEAASCGHPVNSKPAKSKIPGKTVKYLFFILILLIKKILALSIRKSLDFDIPIILIRISYLPSYNYIRIMSIIDYSFLGIL